MLPSGVRCPSRRPSSGALFLGLCSFLDSALHGHNKRCGGLRGFRANNRKNVFVRLFVVAHNIRVRLRFLHFVQRPRLFHIGLRLACTFAHSKPWWRVLFCRNGLSVSRAVPPVVLAIVLFLLISYSLFLRAYRFGITLMIRGDAQTKFSNSFQTVCGGAVAAPHRNSAILLVFHRKYARKSAKRSGTHAGSLFKSGVFHSNALLECIEWLAGRLNQAIDNRRLCSKAFHIKDIEPMAVGVGKIEPVIAFAEFFGLNEVCAAFSTSFAQSSAWLLLPAERVKTRPRLRFVGRSFRLSPAVLRMSLKKKCTMNPSPRQAKTGQFIGAAVGLQT